MIDRDTAGEWVARGARIRVHSGALGHQNHVMAEGTVRGYGDGPMLGIEHDDGRLTWWLTSLPIVEVERPAEPVPTLTRHAHTRDELGAAVRAAYAFADELDSDGAQPTLLAERLRDRLDAVLKSAPVIAYAVHRFEPAYRAHGLVKVPVNACGRVTYVENVGSFCALPLDHPVHLVTAPNPPAVGS